MNSGIIEINIEDVPVTYDFEVVIHDIQDEHPNFKTKHGEFVTSPDVVGTRLLSLEDSLIDPFKVSSLYPYFLFKYVNKRPNIKFVAINAILDILYHIGVGL